MSAIRIAKAYAYVTRRAVEERELLVFKHRDHDVGVQIPKGTIEPGEHPRDAVVRELAEETGIDDCVGTRRLATDTWIHPTKPKRYRRHFFHVEVEEDRAEWHHVVTGAGEDDGLVFECFWHSVDEVDLVRNMDAYLHRLF